MKNLLRKAICYAAIVVSVVAITTSCGDDDESNVIDNNIVTSNARTLQSIAFLPDSYSDVGLPIFNAVKSKYTISGVDEPIENIDATTTASISYRLNPSNASTDDITWKIIRREVTIATRAGEDEVLDGDEFVIDAESKDGILSVSVDGDLDKFLMKYSSSNDYDYVYALVGEYSDGSQVVSDYALYGGEDDDVDYTPINVMFSYDGESNFESSKTTITETPFAVELPKVFGYVDDNMDDAKLLSEYGFEDVVVTVTEDRNELYDFDAFSYLDGYITFDSENGSLTSQVFSYGLCLGVTVGESPISNVEATLNFETELANLDKDSTSVDTDENGNINFYDDSDVSIIGSDIEDDVCGLGYESPSDFISYYKPYITWGNTTLIYGTDFKLTWDGWKYTIVFIGEYEHLSSGSYTFYLYFKYTSYFGYKHFIKIYKSPTIVLPSMSSYSTYGRSANQGYREMSVALTSLITEYSTSYNDDNLTYEFSVDKQATINGYETNTMSGKLDDLQKDINSASIMLGTINASVDVTITFKVYKKDLLQKSVSSVVKFKNPLEIGGTYGHTISCQEGSKCDLKDGLTLTLYSDNASPVEIYSNSSLLEGYGVNEPTFTFHTSTDAAEISNGVVSLPSGGSIEESIYVNIVFESTYATASATKTTITIVE